MAHCGSGEVSMQKRKSEKREKRTTTTRSGVKTKLKKEKKIWSLSVQPLFKAKTVHNMRAPSRGDGQLTLGI